MKLNDRHRAKIEKLKTLLAEASDVSEQLRADSRKIEGAVQLCFWPLVKPDATRQGSEYTAWLAHVDRVIAAAEHEASRGAL